MSKTRISPRSGLVFAGSAIAITILIISGFRGPSQGMKLTSPVSHPEGDDIRLCQVYRDYFPVGTAVSVRTLSGPDTLLLLKHFNSVTPENALKPGPVHPEIDRYDWRGADRIVDFATRHGMKIHGHVLVWHEQAPGWLFKSGDGKVSRDELLRRMKDHIFTVMTRYKGRIDAWDVVNEAVADQGPEIYRRNEWYEICGEDYVRLAFEYAHQADPSARLFYNDYNIVLPEKRERAYRLLKKLLGEGVPVTGVGIQGHWSVFEPSEQELEEAIRRFSSLGLEVQITELDMSVYKWEKDRREKYPGEADTLTAGMEADQVAQYGMIFRTLRENKEAVTGVTFWGMTDRTSWLNHYPVRGRKNYPLLFDREGKPKNAFFEVVNF